MLWINIIIRNLWLNFTAKQNKITGSVRAEYFAASERPGNLHDMDGIRGNRSVCLKALQILLILHIL